MKKLIVMMGLLLTGLTILVGCGRLNYDVEISYENLVNEVKIENKDSIVNIDFGILLKKESINEFEIFDSYKDYKKWISEINKIDMSKEDIEKINLINKYTFKDNKIICVNKYVESLNDTLKGISYKFNEETLELSLLAENDKSIESGNVKKSVIFIVPRDEIKNIKKINLKIFF